MSKADLNPHGGNIYKASAQYGIKKEDFLDYSANINPLGIPSEFKELIISNIDNLVNYPDPACGSLRSNISTYLGTPIEDIVIGNGASEIIFLLFDILAPKKVLIPAPTFSEYAKAAERCGAEIEYLQLEEENGFKLDVDILMTSISDAVSSIVLCNPNNPTSTLVSKSNLLRLVKYAENKNISIIIDEAFIELTEGGKSNSMLEYTKEFGNLFLVRAFTKLFSIPGIRLGYGIGNPELINKMWERKMPWSVNSFACNFGEFLRKADEYIKTTSEWFCRERKWFYDELKQIKGLKVFEPETNFVLIKLERSDFTATRLKNSMAARGILIRNAGNFKFLDDNFFRIAIKDRTDNENLIKTLNEVLQTGG